MRLILLSCFTALTSMLYAQPWLNQNFDGADTIPGQSVFIEIDSNSTDVWMIGDPNKTLFYDAYSQPNVLITDTVNVIPDSTVASFTIAIDPSWYSWGIVAIEWSQKLDLEWSKEAGIIEFSTDTMQTWENVFYHPQVDNFYGYMPANEGYYQYVTEPGFSGQDTTWRNIWLCFGYSGWFSTLDTFNLRFTLKTDSLEHGSEGWMIDNFSIHETWFHTVAEYSDEDEFNSYPTVTADVIKVKCNAKTDPPKIVNVEIFDLTGKLIEEFVPDDVNFERDLSNYTDGSYKIRILTDQGFDILPVIVKH